MVSTEQLSGHEWLSALYDNTMEITGQGNRSNGGVSCRLKKRWRSSLMSWKRASMLFPNSSKYSFAYQW